MKLKWTSLLMIFVVAATLLLALRSTVAQAPPTAPAAPAARVAVVDVGAVFNNYARRNDLNAQFEADRKKLNDDDKVKEQAIEQLQKALESGDIKPETKEYQAQIDQFELLNLERRNWRQFHEQRFVRRHRLLMEGLYQDIVKAVEKTAKERGFDLVLYREDMDLDSANAAELMAKISQRKCLYVDPALDLTKIVTERLNRDYKAVNKPAGP